MSIRHKITYEEAQDKLEKICHQVVESREVVVIEREDGENVALIAAEELSSMEETIYLLRSPANATRLFAALEQVKAGIIEPQTIDELFEELQLDG